MNYIKQLNAFWRWRQMHPLSSGTADVYLAILHFANISGWKATFNIPNQMLMATCGIMTSELYRRRNQLISDGLIHYVNGRKGKAGGYSIIPLYSDIVPEYGNYNGTIPTDGSNIDTNIGNNSATNSSTNPGNILKLNKTLLEDDYHDRARDGWADIESMLDSDLWPDIGSWPEEIEPLAMKCDDLLGKPSTDVIKAQRRFTLGRMVQATSYELVNHAINAAAYYEAKSLRYIVNTLHDWDRRGYKTVDDVIQHEIARDYGC